MPSIGTARALPVIVLAVVVAGSAAAQPFTGGYPFRLPPDDSTTQVFLPRFPAVPLTDDDFISAVGDDFHRRGSQIRFWGGNIVADGAFPTTTESNFIAPRIRKMGFNLMRFHHLDNAWSDHGIFVRNGSTRTIDGLQRGRMEYLIFKLKQEGVYINMNLHVSRTFTEADGVENADSIPDFAKGVTYFDRELIDLQKEYARQLLTHVNPYTGRALVNDPVMAMVEITNENSLYFMWRSGHLTGFSSGGKLIRRHVEMLDDLWTSWLIAKYGTTDALRAAWSADARDEGPDLVSDGGFENSTTITGRWQLEFHGGAVATALNVIAGGLSGPRVGKVNVTTKGTEDWRVQFKQVGLSVVKDTTYTVRFALRADRERIIPVGVTKNVDPWTGYASYNAAVGTDWRTFEFTFTATETVANNVRISFVMGGELGQVWVDDVSMRRAGRLSLDAEERVEDGSVRRLPFSDVLKYSRARMHDLTAFYIHLQDTYFEEMAGFLRNELGVRVPITGTNWNFGLVDLAVQSKLDYVDNHAYWDHPNFPNEPWSSTDWTISNTPMTQATDGGAIARLMAGVAPADKPYTISEYNHAFPNRYQTEGVLFLGAYASLHDVDGVMLFDYNGSKDWTTDKVDSYFSIARNPAMMALMPSMARAYREGMIPEARTTLTAEYSDDEVLGYPGLDGGAWGGTWLFPTTLALKHRVVTGSYGAGTTNVGSLPAATTAPFVSDTGDIRWDTAGLLSVSTAGFSGVAGSLNSFVGSEFGSARIAAADGFGTLTWVSLEPTASVHSGRSMLTLSSVAQNTGMTWDGTRTIHNNWGSAPTVMKPLRVTLRIGVPIAPEATAYLFLHTLDATGVVTSTRRVDLGPNGLEIVLDQAVDRTPWYGIEMVNTTAREGGGLPDRFSFDGIWPNPASGIARLGITMEAGQEASLEVFDMLGRRVLTRPVPPEPGRSTIDLDVSRFAAGLYQVRVTAGGAQKARPLVVR